MEIGHQLEFTCQRCECAVLFSIVNPRPLQCTQCGQQYCFDDGILHQMRLFCDLCRQIHESQEILSSTAIAMDIGSQSVKIPFNLLMTRFSSVLTLHIHGRALDISFRLEPAKARLMQSDPSCPSDSVFVS